MASATAEFSVKRLVKFDGEGNVKAYCDLAIGDQFVVRGLRVMSGKRGLFVSMPRQKGKDGNWYDHVVAQNDETREEVGRVVLSAYQQELASENR